ncbi:MAG: NADH:flavin oxidoreductase/NADH oxidase family protein, partial [Glaciecola sp.]
GTGLLLTGNVMVDARAMTGPGGVALEKDTPLERFSIWAKAAQANDTKVWMQINHPGRQVYANMNGVVYAPSAIKVNLGKLSKLFGEPEAMTETQIEDVITRFGDTAVNAQHSGFNGVQIHAAHGYLLAQFLSPLVNQRTDQWGGDLVNRARLLMRIVDEIKARTAPNFAVSVKLNSADFQRGGFDEIDALGVVQMLEQKGIDLVELSGGSYEAPAMQGMTKDGRTLAREAYFLAFAKTIAQQTTLPIMTTGGITQLKTAQQVLADGVQLVGLATALAMRPDLPNHWQNAPAYRAPKPQVSWRNKSLQALAVMAMIKRNLQRIGRGKAPKVIMSPVLSLIKDQLRKAKLTKRYNKR